MAAARQAENSRIRDTFMYFGASTCIAAGSALAVYRSPLIMNLVTRPLGAMFIVSFTLIERSVTNERFLDDRFGNSRLVYPLHSRFWKEAGFLDGTFCDSRS